MRNLHFSIGYLAALALPGFGPFGRQDARLEHDLESDGPAGRYVEFEVHKGKLLDLVRDFDVLEALDLFPVLDEADRNRVPELGCELSTFHDVYLQYFSVPCG